MDFIPISIIKYAKKHIDNNPSVDEMDLIKRLNTALKDYSNGIKCSCGNDIWVIGSASVGNSCYTCITGESKSDNVYEIDSAIIKRDNNNGKTHIGAIVKSQIHGFFDDDGFAIDIDLIKKPSLCLICINDNNPSEEILCTLTRYDQKDDEEFRCFAFKKI